MFSVIESCKMCKHTVEHYLSWLLDKLKTAAKDEDLTPCLPCFYTE